MLAQYVSGDVIKLMTSSKLYVKLKAIMCFYSVCLHYPDALKAGFPTLRSLLDDSDSSVVMSVLNVLFELCMTNPSNMIQMIPKLFKMLTQKSTNWVTLKLIQIMTVLGKAEPRLAKKLVDPYAEIMSNAQSLSVVYECARSIVEIPVNSPSVMKASVTRIHSYVYSKDPSLRSLFVAIMMSLLKLQPKLCTQYRDLITECLDSDDEGQRLMALDLLAKTGCDGVMVGRGALGNPWLFEEIRAALLGQPAPAAPTLRQKMQTLREQIYDMCERKGEWTAMPQARSQAIHYMRGLRGAAALRRACATLSHFEDVDRLIEAVYRAQD